MGHPRPLFVYFRLFYKQTLNFLTKINVTNVHPVNGTGIRTHDLQNKSLLPYPGLPHPHPHMFVRLYQFALENLTSVTDDFPKVLVQICHRPNFHFADWRRSGVNVIHYSEIMHSDWWKLVMWCDVKHPIRTQRVGVDIVKFVYNIGSW